MVKRIDTEARIESVRLEEQGSAPVSPGAGFSHVWAKSDGLYIVNDSDEEIGPFITGSAGGHSTGTMTIYRDDVHLGVFDEIRFNGSVGAWSSGTYAAVDYDGIGARVYNDANISLADNTLVTLTFNQERDDTDSIHSTVANTSRLTCQTAGKYRISGQVEFEIDAGGTRRLRILLNGSIILNQILLPAVGNARTTNLEISTRYDLSVSDYVELIAWQDSGGAINAQVNANYSPEFMMDRIG